MADMWVGLDLGQLKDYTAAVVIRRSLATDPATGFPQRTSAGFPCYRFDVRAIRRYPLGTPYTAIVSHIVSQLQRPELGPRPRLVLDATGVGVAVSEMFRGALRPHPAIECHEICITSGNAWSVVGLHSYHVAKIQMIGAMREALESRRLKVPSTLPEADTLRRELLDFRVKITVSAHETFNAREGQHDDLVLAVALPIWLANQRWMEMSIAEGDDLEAARLEQMAGILDLDDPGLWD